MTRVDFYILAEEGLAARQAFACKLIQKTAQMGHKIYIHCDNEAIAHEIDKLLWSFQAESFLPHRIVGSGGADCPIEIGYADELEDHDDLLINLSHKIPPFFSRFHRVTEVVSQDKPTLAATRKHYKYYQERNYPLHQHDLR